MSLKSWFRLGHVVRGVVWVALGLVALVTRRAISPDGVVEAMRDLPLGGVILAVAIVGLVGIGLFRLVEAAFDLDHRGDGVRPRLQRLGRAIGALGYLALAWFALQLLLDGTAATPSSTATAHDVRAAPGGGLAMIALGLVVIGAAIGQFATAVTARFMRCMQDDTPGWACWLGRAGHAARGAVFLVVGWSILRFGLGGQHLRDWRQGFAAIGRHPTLFVPVAIGLALFGAFSLVEARYRRFPEDRSVRRKIGDALPG
ncbi:DUF1206 domain-containing protein [Sphingomonas sp. ASV193]|uniref:DUF1206 domain-containing protein n=1 Tax=Sphingomonas sp. ASV193 TaxID=3144405 RepID=UPI0032E85EC6